MTGTALQTSAETTRPAIAQTDYDVASRAYADRRRPDMRITAQLRAALGKARTVLNVGAGHGAYEPDDCEVFALDPALGMLRRHPRRAWATQGVAEKLPFRDQSFDATLSVLSLHHWQDWRSGIAEVVRVTRQRVVLFGWDPAHRGFWLTQDYLPEFRSLDLHAFPAMAEISDALGCPCTVTAVPIPRDCSDGFLGAYWARPEAYLEGDVRAAISTFQRLQGWQPGIERLRGELENGTWKQKYASLLTQDQLDIGYRLIVAELNHTESRTT